MKQAEAEAFLAAVLALPERDADEAFVARIDMSRRAADASRAADRARWEEFACNALAAAALIFAAYRLSDLGAEALDLFLPLAGSAAGLALLWGIVCLLAAAFTTDREEFA